MEFLTIIDNKEYYVVGIVGMEGVFYVPVGNSEIYLSVGDIELEPLDEHLDLFDNGEEYYQVVLNGLINLSPEGCVVVDSFRHGMTFNESMNQVLKNAGINEDISDYKGVIYNTTGENILQISRQTMYGRNIGGSNMYVSLIYDGTVTGEYRYNSKLTGVQIKIHDSNDNLLNYSGNEQQIVEELVKIFGDNYSVSEVGDKVRSYEWNVGQDKVYLAFREYYGIKTGNGDEEIEKWVLHRLSITHSK